MGVLSEGLSATNVILSKYIEINAGYFAPNLSAKAVNLGGRVLFLFSGVKFTKLVSQRCPSYCLVRCEDGARSRQRVQGCCPGSGSSAG